jgi:hypothetical protein
MEGDGNTGFAITSGIQATVSDSEASGNTIGFYADSSSVMNLENFFASGIRGVELIRRRADSLAGCGYESAEGGSPDLT